MRAAYIAVLLLLQLLAVCETADRVIHSDSHNILRTKPVLRHDEPVRCVSPTEVDTSGRRMVVAKQLKPGMSQLGVPSISLPPLRFNFTSKNYIVQTCYNVGYVDSKVEHDITLVTFGSVDRLYNIIRTSMTWTGMISIAIYIKHPSEVAAYVDPLIKGNPTVAERVTIHLLFENGEPAFPVNALRNLATVGVITTHFLNCDLDFVPAYQSYENAIVHQRLFARQLYGEIRTLFVVPAVEMVSNVSQRAGDRFEEKYLSLDVQHVKHYIRNGRLIDFAGRARGWGYHQPSDLSKWLNATKPYSLPTRNLRSRGVPDLYEPYCVMPTRLKLRSEYDGVEGSYSFLLWDELFTEYGSNKVVFLKMMRNMYGYNFMVLPNTLLYHMRHPASDAANKFYFNADIKERMFALYRLRLRFWWETALAALKISSRKTLPPTIERHKQSRFLPLHAMQEMNQNITGDHRHYRIPFRDRDDRFSDGLATWRRPEVGPAFKPKAVALLSPQPPPQSQSTIVTGHWTTVKSAKRVKSEPSAVFDNLAEQRALLVSGNSLFRDGVTSSSMIHDIYLVDFVFGVSCLAVTLTVLVLYLRLLLCRSSVKRDVR